MLLMSLYLKFTNYMFLVCITQDRFLAYSPQQHPIVLQIGGSNLDNLAKATELATAYGYDEINFKLEEFFLSRFIYYFASFLFSFS